MVKEYRNKHTDTVVEAIQFHESNVADAMEFCPTCRELTSWKGEGRKWYVNTAITGGNLLDEGDYIYKTDVGFWRCERSVFEDVYEELD